MITSPLAPRYVNFVYALVVGRACSTYDRCSNVKIEDIWDDEECVKLFAGLIIQTLPIPIGDDWFDTMANRRKKQTISTYLKNTPNAIPPHKAAAWIIRNKHIISRGNLNDARLKYLERCTESLVIAVDHPDAEHPVSPKMRRAYEEIKANG